MQLDGDGPPLIGSIAGDEGWRLGQGSACGSGFIGRLPGLPRSTFNGNGTGGLGMALPPRALRGKFARFRAGKRGVPKNNFPGQKAGTAGAKLAAQPRSNASRNTFSKPSPSPWIGSASLTEPIKSTSLRLQLLDTLRPLGETMQGCRAYCR